jgi:hypothetical protein
LTGGVSLPPTVAFLETPVNPSLMRTVAVLGALTATIAWLAWPGPQRSANSAGVDAEATMAQVRRLIESGQPPTGSEGRYPLVPREAPPAEGGSVLAIGLAHAQADAPAIGAPAPKASGKDAAEIDWLELMPAEDIKKLQEIPAVDHSGFVSAEQFMSFNTVKELDGRKGKIAGYIVPIETDDKGNLTSFFLVPYFGACIHVPPPPPNQIVYAKLAKPIPVPDMYAPQWVDGTLVIERTDNELGASAYTMKVDTVTTWDG